MALHVKNGGVWKQVKNPFVRDGGVWKKIEKVFVRDGGVWKQAFQNTIVATYGIAANRGTFYLAATMGNPTTKVDVTLNIAANVQVVADTTAVPALDLRGLPAGSVVRLNVASGAWVVGRGGTGGTGSNMMNYGPARGPGAGGDAIWYDANTTLVLNNAGTIGGGGGGGGGSWSKVAGSAPAGVLYVNDDKSGMGGGAGAGYGGISTEVDTTAADGTYYHTFMGLGGLGGGAGAGRFTVVNNSATALTRQQAYADTSSTVKLAQIDGGVRAGGIDSTDIDAKSSASNGSVGNGGAIGAVGGNGGMVDWSAYGAGGGGLGAAGGTGYIYNSGGAQEGVIPGGAAGRAIVRNGGGYTVTAAGAIYGAVV